MTNLETIYGIKPQKLCYKESPIYTTQNNIEKNYSLDSEKPIRISYGARLEKVQKRVDLLIPLIKELEELAINYQLKICGDGSYYSVLNDFIQQNSLSKKITLLGRLDHKKMFEFWNDSDIFINMSESEGVGISMLEAMSCGSVPIEFEISGSDEFIEDGVNGYIIKKLSCKDMAKKIEHLYSNRPLISKMGTLSRQIVEKKCNFKDYINYMINAIM